MVETSYAYIEFKSKKGNWSINLPFLCNQCGVCCTLDDFLVAGPVKINPLENPKLHAKLQALYDDLGRRWEVDEEKYDKFITHTPCPFLTDKKCSIYPVRPEGCRQFPNTPFGMLSTDCKALTRFKKQLTMLKKGRKTTQTLLLSDIIKPTKFSAEQFQKCLAKLRKAGATEAELALFQTFNGQK
jgi:Fe-S-cluster containining protein